MFETKHKNNNRKSEDGFKPHLDHFVFYIIALVSFLVYIHFQMNQHFIQRKHTAECHTSALVASETLDDSINDVEYYEFLYKTCMREAGIAI